MRLSAAHHATMTPMTTRSTLTSALTRHPHPIALMLGLFLGQIVAVMAQPALNPMLSRQARGLAIVIGLGLLLSLNLLPR